MIIYTDRPLESIFDSLPPLQGVPPSISGTELGFEFRPRLKFGVMEFINWTSIMRIGLKGYEPLDCEWWAYYYNCPLSLVWKSEYPIRDNDCHLITSDLLFIYWYLGNVGNVLAIEFGECPYADEVPVSHIDISRYGAGIRPMSGSRRLGVRYVFTDSLKTSRQHDTSFWEFAATLNDTGDYQWRSLPDYTTLRELICLCGDVISSIALFERDINSSDVLPLASRCGDIPEPLMVVPVDSCEHTLCDYLDHQDISCSLYTKDSMSLSKIPCIGNEIGIAVILQNTPYDIGSE